MEITKKMKETIHTIHNSEASAVWVYMFCMEKEGIEINRLNLRVRFNLGTRKLNRSIRYLSKAGLISVIQERINGRFGKNRIIVFEESVLK